MDREYLTKKEVMEYLKISYSHVDRLFKCPDFPRVNLGGKALVTKENLNDYLDKYTGKEIPIRASSRS